MTTLSRLLAAAAVLLGTLAGPARADGPTTPPAGTPTPGAPTSIAPDPTNSGGKSRVTVGIQTATPQGPDQRARYVYTLDPRGVRQDTVAVFNYSGRPAVVGLSAKDATSTPEGAFIIQDEATKATDVGSWISLSRTRLTLPPRSMALVPFQVGVPYNVTPGDHAGAVLLSIATSSIKQGKQVIVSNRVGLRVLIRVPGALKPQLTIENLRTEARGGWHWWGWTRPHTTYTVRNTGNVTLTGATYLRYLRSFGMDPLSVPDGQLPDLLPGGTTDVTVDHPGAFTFWHLTTEVQVDPAGQDLGQVVAPTAIARTTITVIPWALLAVLVALVLLLQWAIRRLLRRRAEPETPEDADPSAAPDGDGPAAAASDPVLQTASTATTSPANGDS
ncbi:hypothetical protein K8Z61_09485 [Nocardioides sp. TRM66260-LWL]|uniref:hypothetical protein n=1 Tax=Nocardioides sp. TRM66260-LWL TaxID=2874478 RepID=UPI001CC6E2B7|nr:hypothetical protein [Nocardioides sp. TRM66260-LWL]MBZ5734727.1 hypothetical protein [Nocardioides sp. TRM66260-LWL]